MNRDMEQVEQEKKSFNRILDHETYAGTYFIISQTRQMPSDR